MQLKAHFCLSLLQTKISFTICFRDHISKEIRSNYDSEEKILKSYFKNVNKISFHKLLLVIS